MCLLFTNGSVNTAQLRCLVKIYRTLFRLFKQQKADKKVSQYEEGE